MTRPSPGQRRPHDDDDTDDEDDEDEDSGGGGGSGAAADPQLQGTSADIAACIVASVGLRAKLVAKFDRLLR